MTQRMAVRDGAPEFLDAAASEADRRFVADLVKRKIIEELASCVHAIQQQLAEDHCAVVSDALGERLCGLIEAVFLHGQRPNSWSLKLSSALGVSKTSVLQNTNFWALVSSVCHRDILQRISFLQSARSDVGRCRIWLRYAFNDSLFESYLMAVTGNEEMISSYYQTWSFLCDKEMVDVLRGHLLGLQNFAFRLSVDKPELNRWERQMLVLAGLLPDQDLSAPKSPLATGAPVDVAMEAVPQTPDESEFSPEELTVIHTRITTRKPRSNTSPIPQPPTVVLPPPSLPSDPPLIDSTAIQNRDNELEAILKLTLSSREETPPVSGADVVDLTRGGASVPVPIGRSLLGERVKEEDDGLEMNQSPGSNMLGRGVGWSSDVFEDVDGGRGLRGRTRRADTHESFDAVLERGIAITPGFSSSLGIGSQQFAQMVDAFQSDSSSSNGTPTASQSGASPSSFDHDFEILNTDHVYSSRMIEGKKRELLVVIPVEKGLRAQHYKCGACARPVGLLYGKTRLCNFDRLYYCLDCHIDEEAIIPSLVIHNWDFRKYRVCSKAKELIDAVESTPLFDIKELNPKLYIHVRNMEETQANRVQLQIVKSYLWTCKKEVLFQFNQKLWPQDHLHETMHVYSLTDLLMVYNGTLIPKMKAAIQFGIEHIRKCFLCSQRGFICEVCRVGEVLHAFDTKENYQCLKCYAVFHKKCMNATKPCPKCQRKMLQAQRSAQKASHES